MKKISSIFLAVIMLVSCFSFGASSAYANTRKTAEVITTSKSVTATVDKNDAYFWIKFVPEETGYYEFTCKSAVENGEVDVTLLKSTGDAINFDFYDSFTTDRTLAGKLTANKTYYFCLEGDGKNEYTTKVTVKTHKHTIEKFVIPAYADVDEPDYSYDGGVFKYCNGSCGYYEQTATYYYPKTVTLSKTSYVYDGNAKKPKVTVKDRRGNTISSSNYTVTYKNNTKAGKATVTVKFNGNKYEGSIKKTFTIKPKKATLSSVKSAKSRQLTVKWKKDSTVTGYQIQYSTSSNFSSSKSITITKSSTTSRTISNLKAGKKYYVRVREYKTIDGNKVYGAWSKSMSATTKK